jgi:hypothetical protein
MKFAWVLKGEEWLMPEVFLASLMTDLYPGQRATTNPLSARIRFNRETVVQNPAPGTGGLCMTPTWEGDDIHDVSLILPPVSQHGAAIIVVASGSTTLGTCRRTGWGAATLIGRVHYPGDADGGGGGGAGGDGVRHRAGAPRRGRGGAAHGAAAARLSLRHRHRTPLAARPPRSLPCRPRRMRTRGRRMTTRSRRAGRGPDG